MKIIKGVLLFTLSLFSVHSWADVNDEVTNKAIDEAVKNCDKQDGTNAQVSCLDHLIDGNATLSANHDFSSIRKVNDNKTRLAAYTQLFVQFQPPKVIPPKPIVEFRLLQSADLKPALELDTVDKPAIFSMQRDHGVDATLAQATLLMIGRPYDANGEMQPFGSISWNRDTSNSDKKKDLRDFGLGTTLPEVGPDTFHLLSDIRYRYRKDQFDTKTGNALVLNSNAIYKPFVNNTHYVFYPYFGAQMDDRNGGAATDGKWNSLYGGLYLEVPLAKWSLLPGLTFAARFERFHDVSVPSGQTKRSANASKAELIYQFVDPDNKQAAWKPSITLSREVGEDVRAGGDRTNKNVISLGISYSPPTKN